MLKVQVFSTTGVHSPFENRLIFGIDNLQCRGKSTFTNSNLNKFFFRFKFGKSFDIVEKYFFFAFIENSILVAQGLMSSTLQIGVITEKRIDVEREGLVANFHKFQKLP